MRGNRIQYAPICIGVRSIPACAGEPNFRNILCPSARVYPRVCGGTHPPFHSGHSVRGLSPRVRGNQKICIRMSHWLGSIPACAGEPLRWCAAGDADKGLSPRVRGNPRRCNDAPVLGGSIPACAGEPTGPLKDDVVQRVYPRVCGGTLTSALRYLFHFGLSPRVRGNRTMGTDKCNHAGSIPACAGEPAARMRRRRQGMVYPRVCGGTSPTAGRLLAGIGLSPRVRGNQWRRAHLYGIPGSIPACAGEPASLASSSGSGGVYPRVCGGTISPRSPKAASKGLSPRVRGNREQNGYRRDYHWSIPACAGEPDARRFVSRNSTVYPRVCGGTPASARQASRIMGLSPRVRGNPPGPARRRQCPGSIPACAGEPRQSLSPSCLKQVYPRVCGGTSMPAFQTPSQKGLSPRVRGNRGRQCGHPQRHRSIPACAGEPVVLGLLSTAATVYPRVCGGTPERRRRRPPWAGLSPRVRGNRLRLGRRTVSNGSIPACAGEPVIVRGSGEIGEVYPRVCGGTVPTILSITMVRGLSPRVRGNPGRQRHRQSVGRSIPACAGEPTWPATLGAPQRVYPRVCGGTRML